MELVLCPNCKKVINMCVCEHIVPLKLEPHVLILQHPQESDKELGTATLTKLVLENSTLKIGLSWPNLNKALGFPADPKNWLVLYLGSAADLEKIKGEKKEVVVVSKKGTPLPTSDEIIKNAKGIILLDGNWSQSKSIWWRNAWLLKCNRVILNPSTRSLYGSLRKEPRRESLATIEAAYYVLKNITQDHALENSLLGPFKELLNKKKGGRS